MRSIVVSLLNGLREKQRQFREASNARKVRETEDRNRSIRDWTGSSNSRTSAAASLGPGRDSIGSRSSKEDLRKFPSGRSQGGGGSQSGPSSARNPSSTAYPAQRGDSRPVSPTASIPIGRPPSANSMRGQGAPQRAYSTDEGTFSPPSTSPAARQGSLRESDYSARSPAADQGQSELAYQSIPTSRSNGSLTGSIRHSTDRTRPNSPPPQPRIAEPIPASPTLISPNLPSQDRPPTGPPPIPLPIAPDQAANPGTEASQMAAQLQSLEALKSSDNLSRRASKRYSAYAMGKMTSGSSTSPSGRDGARERGGSDLARGAGSGSSAGRELAHGSGEDRRGAPPGRRAKSELRSSQRGQAPPLPTMPTSISWNERQLIAPILEETDSQGNSPFLSPSASFSDGLSPHPPSFSPELAAASPVTAPPAPPPSLPPKEPAPAQPSPDDGFQHKRSPTNASDESEPESFPMSVFLKIGRDVKKARLEERPTVGDLRLLFIERFQYNPGQSDFPTINLRDQTFGVEYLLEDINEVKNGSIISLGIDSKSRRPSADERITNFVLDFSVQPWTK